MGEGEALGSKWRQENNEMFKAEDIANFSAELNENQEGFFRIKYRNFTEVETRWNREAGKQERRFIIRAEKVNMHVLRGILKARKDRESNGRSGFPSRMVAISMEPKVLMAFAKFLGDARTNYSDDELINLDKLLRNEADDTKPVNRREGFFQVDLVEPIDQLAGDETILNPFELTGREFNTDKNEYEPEASYYIGNLDDAEFLRVVAEAARKLPSQTAGS